MGISYELVLGLQTKKQGGQRSVFDDQSQSRPYNDLLSQIPARLRAQTAATGQPQADYQAAAPIQLDRQGQIAVNRYHLLEKDILPRNEASRSAQSSEPGEVAEPAPQSGEWLHGGSRSYAGTLVRTDANNYSVYWPGLHNNQLKYISEQVRRIIAQSGTLRRQLDDYKDVQIVYGPTEDGTKYEFKTNTITIAEIKRDSPRTTTGSLAHEAGHIDGPEIDAESVESYLDSEGAAQMNRIRIRNEILARGGEDIGIGGSKENRPAYLYIYNEYIAGQITYLEAINRIGNIYGDKEHPSFAPHLTYRQFYKRQCEQQSN